MRDTKSIFTSFPSVWRLRVELTRQTDGRIDRKTLLFNILAFLFIFRQSLQNTDRGSVSSALPCYVCLLLEVHHSSVKVNRSVLVPLLCSFVTDGGVKGDKH